jgi:hypothetical protein
MTKKTIVGFVMVSLSLVACAAQTSADGSALATDENTSGTAEALINRNPEVGESCHVAGAGITQGTMTNSGWCCGVATCDDKQTCGNEYGHQVASCAACDWYKCDPGSTRIKIDPSVLVHLSEFGAKQELVSSYDPKATTPFKARTAVLPPAAASPENSALTK